MRLLIISNRLPVTATDDHDELKFEESIGGLVSGINTYLDAFKKDPQAKVEYLWIGWPGLATEEGRKKSRFEKKLFSLFRFFFKKPKGEIKKEVLKARIRSEYNSHPVFLSGDDVEKFYFGFCNKTIWPLFHYFPQYAVYDEEYWNCYKRVNEAFCDAVMEVVRPDDTVWVHDYQLMLLPGLLRRKMPGLSIGFFLHIPFPSFEVYRLMPREWRTEILEGILGADLAGFHTHEYTQYFLRCVLRLLGMDHSMGEIIFPDRLIRADTFPMGINFEKFYNARNNKEVNLEKSRLKAVFRSNRIIFSVDRLDYTKGILNRLKGFEKFLEKYPQWHNKVVFVLIVVPSRTGVDQYQQMKKDIDEFVGSINGRFGNMDWMPLIYQYRSISFEYMVALYNLSSVGLITPLRDGMNLVAKEYVASQPPDDGVLILSEMAGAAKELGEALIINPNHTAAIADALHQALEMPKEEINRRTQSMQKRLKRYDVVKWADEFIRSLGLVREKQKKLSARLMSGPLRARLADDFKKADNRLILLDYDGTLVPFTDHPQKSIPPESLMKTLRELGSGPNNDLVLISGRDRETLDNWFSGLPLGLVAEHGAWMKERQGEWKMIKPLTGEWKAEIRPILEIYTDRLPGSFIEEKQFALVWHFRRADPEMAVLRKRELVDELVQFTANIDIQIMQGSQVIEVSNAGVNKGAAALQWAARKQYDLILAVGDDWTDEDMFKALPPSAYTFKVGLSASYARFNLTGSAEAVKLISELAE